MNNIINGHIIDDKGKDKHGHDLDYYNKLFPINETFYYVSKYGGRAKLISKGVHKSNHNGIAAFYVGTVASNDALYSLNYDVDDCISTIRNKKIKRLTEDD